MANDYSVTSSDFYPRRMPSSVWLQLVDDDGDGDADLDLDADVVGPAIEVLESWMGGALTGAAAIALARPHLVSVAVYLLHERRSQMRTGDDAGIPPAVARRYEQAASWAAETGRALVAEEGGSVAPVGSPTEYVSPDERYAQEDLDPL